MNHDDKQALAMVFQAVKQPFLSHRMQLPELAADEVLVQIDYTTICSSDLHTFYGRRNSPYPGILGHEIMGKVVQIADGGVKDHYGEFLRIGDRITWSVYAHDHEGEMAKKGIPQKSADLFKYGHEKLNNRPVLSGGFATHCQLRSGTDIFKLPASLSPKEAAPLNCTHATIAGALRLAGDLAGKNVLIIGAGMLGISACAMSREAGAGQVWAMDINKTRREKSLAFGVDIHFDAALSAEILLQTMQKSGGVDVIIETSGVPAAIEKGIELLNIGGICVLVGAVFAQRDLAVNAERIVRNILTIKGLHNYIPEDLAQAIRFLGASRHNYPFETLVAREFPLSQLDEAFATADEGLYFRVGVFPGD